ncbi:uncharacterized protein LOC126842659 isoform X2 [Adelges cooleyi]|nr:uncharacterized protein LOC126842659 isoform X2 [Adelges cooleyi]XP_050435699.1 uncharacterized protein LOC126842659 isoform X2 [Adelges cooleyi]XP_050435706.1 uncharacterized protein LOC126842659 isoform X2 [Adelges cooleyi]
MKLFGFLISFFIVNVSTKLAFYKKMVLVTNEHIKLASDKNNFTIGQQRVANGLEHVILQLVDTIDPKNTHRDSVIFILNNMFAVLVWDFKEDLGVLAEHQQSIQYKIENYLKIDIPKVTNQDFYTLDLEQLGEERRSYTRIALNNILNRLIDSEKIASNLTSRIEERTVNPTKVKQKQIAQIVDSKRKVPLLLICRLLAVFISTKFPKLPITVVHDQPGIQACYLYDKFKTCQAYRDINRVWWIVNCENFNVTIRPLNLELL